MKAVMLGGLQCGKTSALASMFAQVLHGQYSEYFNVVDRTLYGCENVQEESMPLLQDKAMELVCAVEKPSHCQLFMTYGGSSCSINKYTLGIQLTGNSISVDFVDVPGSMLPCENFHYSECLEFVKGCDVVIVALDTPFLMECNEAIAMAVNRIDDVSEILTQICCNCVDAKSSKMVVFMPVKCEKWVKENRIDEVNGKITRLFSSMIHTLIHNKYITTCIIPVQTVGNIEFAEMRDAYLIRADNESVGERCSIIGDNIVRLSNGEYYEANNNDFIYEDSSARVFPTELIRPNAWYMKSRKPFFSSGGHLYNPHNCDQLLLHILRFGARKVLSIPMLLGIIPVGGTKPANAFMSLLSHNPNIIKDDIEGIEYLNAN